LSGVDVAQGVVARAANIDTGASRGEEVAGNAVELLWKFGRAELCMEAASSPCLSGAAAGVGGTWKAGRRQLYSKEGLAQSQLPLDMR